MALKRTPFARKTPMPRTPMSPATATRLAAKAKRNSKQLPPVSKAVRLELLERQDNRCPHCDRPMLEPAAHVHHRKERSQGGTNDLDNLLLLPGTCHGDVHANPARSYELGHLVKSHDDPSAVRVRPLSPGWTVAT